jgi:hypothetical protein
VFSRRRRRITSARFPHSGIHGSKAIQRLTVAYRSRSRPSSTLGAKASTMCPYYLDGDRTLRFRGGSVIPVVVVLIVTTTMWLLCSFQGPQGGAPRDSRAGLSKLNSMHRRSARDVRTTGPGPVDILGRTVGDRRIRLVGVRPEEALASRGARAPRMGWTKATSRRRRRAARAPLRGSLERR